MCEITKITFSWHFQIEKELKTNFTYVFSDTEITLFVENE